MGEYWLRIRDTQRANGFLSVSEATTKDLVELYNVSTSYVSTSWNRISTNYKPACATEVADFKRMYGISKPYIAVVGARYEYKNYGILWQALNASSQLQKHFQVVMTGHREYMA